MRFSEKIELLCGERGWNRAELARRMRVSKTTAGNWWDGKRQPYDDKLPMLARLFGVTVDYLTDDKADEPPKGLTEEERWILKLSRELGPDEAIRRLAAVPTGPGSVGLTLDPKTGEPQPRPGAVKDRRRGAL